MITHPIRKANAVIAKHPKTTITDTTRSLFGALRPETREEDNPGVITVSIVAFSIINTYWSETIFLKCKQRNTQIAENLTHDVICLKEKL